MQLQSQLAMNDPMPVTTDSSNALPLASVQGMTFWAMLDALFERVFRLVAIFLCLRFGLCFYVLALMNERPWHERLLIPVPVPELEHSVQPRASGHWPLRVAITNEGSVDPSTLTASTPHHQR